MRELHYKKYIVRLERYPQRDFIDRQTLALNDEEAVETVLNTFFKENKKQKVRLSRCIEIIR